MLADGDVLAAGDALADGGVLAVVVAIGGAGGVLAGATGATGATWATGTVCATGATWATGATGGTCTTGTAWTTGAGGAEEVGVAGATEAAVLAPELAHPASRSPTPRTATPSVVVQMRVMFPPGEDVSAR